MHVSDEHAPRSPLRAWRKREGISLQEMSDLTGYSLAMLSRLENGRRSASFRAKVAMARRLRVPIRELFPVA
jgi:transcriptional regulator with XRE-family HTH domain